MSGCGKSEAAKNAERAISNIGTVNLESEQLISDAFDTYQALTPEEQSEVSNYSTLETAQETLQKLEADAVSAAIDSIGEVTLESEALIASAEEKYLNLSNDLKPLVTNHRVLIDARAIFDVLVEDELIAEVERAILSIGKVNEGSLSAIEHAENLYNNLSERSQREVRNPSAISDARKEYETLLIKNQVAAMTSEELEAALLNEPMYIQSTKYVVQDTRYKSLYPDMLQAIVKNNSGGDIKNAVVAFVAWDSNGFPVKIETRYSYSGGSYVIQCNYSDINMVDGATYGKNSGLTLDSDTAAIATFKAIVVSYEDFDGNTWNNPHYDIWEEMYADKKLK